MSRYSAALAATLLLAPSTAQQPPVLPQERELTDPGVVSEQRHVLFVEALKDAIGWTSFEISRATLDDATVYLVRQLGELADLEAGRVRPVEATSLWTEELELIAVRSTNPDGTRADYRWRDGGLWRLGHKPVRVEAAGRPGADPELLLALRGPEACEADQTIRWHSLDLTTGEVVEESLVRGGRYTLGEGDREVKATEFKSSQADGSLIYVTDDRLIERIEVEAQTLTGQFTEVDATTLRRSIAANSTLLAAAVRVGRTSWEQRRGRWHNDALAVELQLPKQDWVRRLKLTGNTVFSSEHTSGDAAFSIAIEPVGSGHETEEYAAVIEASLESDVNDIESVRAKLGKRPATRLDYTRRQGDREFRCKMWIVVHEGLAYQCITAVSRTQASKYRRQLDSITRRLELGG